MKKTLKNEKGITLATLVITVIIILILAGVVISMLRENGGLLERTQIATDMYSESAQSEANQIINLMNSIDNVPIYNMDMEQEPDIPTEPETLVVKLAEGMVPVTYNTEDSSWYVATQEEINNKSWYDYVDTTEEGQENQSKWANAMLRDNLQVEDITDAKTATLEEMYGKKVTKEGSMYVWIPRYAYKITSNLHNGGVGIVGDIDVELVNINNKNEDEIYSTTYPETTDIGKATGSMNEFVVHPAFSWEKEDGTPVELEGIWIGKFEASSANASYTATQPGNVSTSPTVILRTVGNVSSWRSININNIFSNCYNMNTPSNAGFYGISTDKDKIDPHLIKNIEWGATVYLAHSKYGRNKIVAETMTNLSGYSTGNGNYKNNVGLSTTKNVYGVYDLAGGAWCQVAAYVDSTKDGTVANQYLTGVNYGKSLYMANAKYKDVYVVGPESDARVYNYNANSNKYGDGIYETSSRSYNGSTYGNSSWNQDHSRFPLSATPFLCRGGSYGNANTAGVFAFGHLAGGPEVSVGFRPVIVIP